ncbi:hypothetical protein RD792_010138 [Penstemon davidsonii]|uniref:Ubiquitin receptor RAD23 n=1 Tax=Penstemon davidsonii TaxID=160366 RepID=A0ABR0D0Z6_9LAMI|nr:hypothetical protein RD792_010138 [Penstemon davidsonii]
MGVLKNESTLAQNKSKTLSSSGSTSSQPAPIAAPATNPTTVPASNLNTTPEVVPPPPAPKSTRSTYVAQTTSDPSNPYAGSASNLVGGNNLDQTIQQLIDMGGGSWDRETVIRALRAAYNNPERAVDYLHSGIPESTELAVPLAQPAVNLAFGGVDAVPASGAPNSSPLNLFPQEAVSGAAGAGLGSLDFLRNNPQILAMGFERALIIEAFLACGRNEELAVNYLLDNAGDFED